MASNDELACIYAALILHDDGISITADKIATILKAAGVSVEPYWPTLFAKALDGIDIGSLLGSLGSAASAVSAGAPPLSLAVVVPLPLPLHPPPRKRRRKSRKRRKTTVTRSPMKTWDSPSSTN